MDRVMFSTLDVQPRQSLVTIGLCYRCLWRSTWRATELRVAGVTQWMRDRELCRTVEFLGGRIYQRSTISVGRT